MSKYLIVNADDFGMCSAANEAVFDLFLSGRLKSSTIMMPCPAAEAAVEFSKAHPEFAIGIHTTLTSEWDTYRWKPFTNGKSLLDPQGYMWPDSTLVEKNADYKELMAEMRAQIDAAHNMGMKPSHIDNHMGSLYGNKTGRFTLLRLAFRVCGEYGYAYRMFSKADKAVLPAGTPLVALRAAALMGKLWSKVYGVPTIDYLLFPDWGAEDIRCCRTYEEYRKLILNIWFTIPEGITETFVHPCVENDELKGIVGMWEHRVWEYQLMKDPETEKALNAHGITLISYRDMLEMRKAK